MNGAFGSKNLSDRQIDPCLRPLLQTKDSEQQQFLMEELISSQAQPVIKRVVRRRLSARLARRALERTGDVHSTGFRFLIPLSVFDIHMFSVYDLGRGGMVTMHRRINITLPEQTLRLIDRAVEKGDRSRFINEAIKHFVRSTRRSEIRELLKEGALKRAERDLLVAEEWFGIDEEVWGSHRK